MTESHEDKLSLINDILNDFLSFDGNIEYKVVLEPFDDVITHFSVEATIDSAMYHMVSPDYNPDYEKFITYLDDKIYKLVDRYFGDEVQYEVVVFFHKNVDKVISVAKPMLDKAMRVYSIANGKPVLHIQTSNQGQNLILNFSDEGIGIGKGYEQKVFEKFFRIPTGDVHNVKGFGLGLAYVKKIVELHGGSIELESEKGKGSKFTIRIPHV